jgi:inosine-uridine nucleoside N-ribohydrolase
MARPLIIDFFPSPDSVFSVLTASASGVFDIKALCLTTGSTSTEDDNRTLSWLKQFLPESCTLVHGASEPIIKLPEAPDFAGRRKFNPPPGLNIQNIPDAQKQAWEIIRDAAKQNEGELEIITLGPLTSAAITLLRYPEIAQSIKQITVSGGSAHSGNVSAYAEYNIAADPYAAQLVFNSGIPLVMAGLDASEGARLSDKELDDLSFCLAESKHPAAEAVKSALESRDDFKTDCYRPIATACLIDSTIGTFKPCFVEVETQSRLSLGQTVTDLHCRSGKDANVDVLLDVDKAKFLSLLKKIW